MAETLLCIFDMIAVNEVYVITKDDLPDLKTYPLK